MCTLSRVAPPVAGHLNGLTVLNPGALVLNMVFDAVNQVIQCFRVIGHNADDVGIVDDILVAGRKVLPIAGNVSDLARQQG